MRHASGIAAVLVILTANAFALIHAARNRVGNPESEITLTQRELALAYRAPSDDDSGVSLNLQWEGPSRWFSDVTTVPDWLNEQTLRKLGFDCQADPARADAERFYQRQRPRHAFVALEYDGAAWKAWLDAFTYSTGAQSSGTRFYTPGIDEASHSHLVSIDADLDAQQLRSRHPDRTKIIILPAVIGIALQNFPNPALKRNPRQPPRLTGTIQDLPTSIHVPRPFSDQFQHLLHQGNSAVTNGTAYRVHLSFGNSLEPVITGVELLN